MSEVYDPQGPEEGQPSSSSVYLTKKDVKWIALILVILGIFMIPIYKMLRETANDHLCVQNFKQMSESLSLYEASNDGRYPPLFATDAAGAPALDADGRAFSWVTLLQSGMNNRASFVCPSSDPEDQAISQHPSDSTQTIHSSYGFYSSYGLPAPNGDMEASEVPNPDMVILIAETNNNGSKSSADPFPYKDVAGKAVPNDGFVIGYNDSNTGITRDSHYVTRLAFQGTNDGVFDGKLIGRHNKGIHMITASGRLLIGKPADSKLTLTSPAKPTGMWAIPTGIGQSGVGH